MTATPATANHRNESFSQRVLTHGVCRNPVHRFRQLVREST